MHLYSEAEFLTGVVIVVFCLWRHATVDATTTEPFSYEYLDSDKTILKLRCDGDSSTDITVHTIVIFNSTSMSTMGVLTSGKALNLIKESIPEKMSYYIAGGLLKDGCHLLELVITNCSLSPRLQFGCNVTHSDNGGNMKITTTSLTVDRRKVEVSQEGSQNISSTTLISLIVVIIVLFLVAVFFLSMWVRGCCLHRDKMIYRSSPYGEISNSQVFNGDTASVLSFQRSPSQMNDMKESEYKFPTSGVPVQKMNSTGSRSRYPPLPSVPPPKLYWKETQNPQAPGNAVKVPYARPQDAIEPDFSEDGDVTSSNGGAQQTYFLTNEPTDNPQPFYSSVPVRSVDV